MEVTKSNFKEVLELFEKLLPQADTVSFDLEFTGIKPQFMIDKHDSFYERYLKVKDPANEFKIIQIGLCIFIKREVNQYEVYPFNFYIFPALERGVDQAFKIQTESIYFLKAFEMDFNKWIKEGVSYVNTQQLSDLKEKFEDELFNIDSQLQQLKFQKLQWEKDAFLKEYKSKINTFMNMEQSAEEEKEDGQSQPEDQNVLTFKEFPLRFKKYLMEQLQTEELQGLQYYETQDEVEKCRQRITVTLSKEPLNNEKAQSAQDRAKLQMERKLFETIGFTHIWNLLIKYQPKLVGHNSILDVLFMYSHFDNELPQDFREFIADFNKKIPNLYDTKFMYTMVPQLAEVTPKGTALENMCKAIDANESVPEIKWIYTDDRFSSYAPENDQNRLHEAGYDSFITGQAFLKGFPLMTQEQKSFVKNKIHNFHCDFLFDTTKISLELGTPEKKEIWIWLRTKFFISKDELMDTKDAFTEMFKDEIGQCVSIRHHFVLGKMKPIFIILWDAENEENLKMFENKIGTLQKQGFSFMKLPEYSEMLYEFLDEQQQMQQDRQNRFNNKGPKPQFQQKKKIMYAKNSFNQKQGFQKQQKKYSQQNNNQEQVYGDDQSSKNSLGNTLFSQVRFNQNNRRKKK